MGISWERSNPAEVSSGGNWIFSQSRNFLIKKERPHGNRHGRTEEQRQHHIAHNFRNGCVERGFEGTHDRFQNDSTFRDSQLGIDRTEEVCIQMDKDAHKKISPIERRKMSTYDTRIGGSLNKSGKIGPMKDRSDFNEALTKLHRRHQESGAERLAPILFWQYQQWHPSSSSSSTSWWQWNDSWWSSWKFIKSQAHLSSWKSSTWNGVTRCAASSQSCSEVTPCKIFVIVRSFTADSNLLQPTGGVNSTAHTSHFLVDLHAHAWLKSQVSRAHLTSHASSSPLFSFCSPFSVLSSCPSSWPSTSSSTMLWTNSLCTSAHEDLGTLAEYDPLTAQRARSASTKKGSSEAGVRLGRPVDRRAKTFLKSSCTNLPRDYWHLPECPFFFLNRVVNSARNARLHTGKLKGNPARTEKG